MFRLANPNRFMQWSGKLVPWCAIATTVLLAVGLYLALFVAPPDARQGEGVRIMYVHVPAAWMSLLIYAVMALSSAVALIWRHPVADIAAREAAPLGAGFTLLCLVSGSLWGKPMWGTWWVWDARLTSELILFFLYIGYLALINAFDEPTRGARAGSIMALVGIMMLPIIVFSVDCWNTLHQPPSMFRAIGMMVSRACGRESYESVSALQPSGSGLPSSMLWPLLVMGVAFTVFFVTLWLMRMRSALMAAKLRAIRLQQAA